MQIDPNDPLIQPGVIPLHAAAPDAIALAAPSMLFDDRARRFDHFAAKGDDQRAFFRFMAALSRAQHDAAARFVPRSLPDAAAIELRHQHRMPVLPAGFAERDPSWVDALRGVMAASVAGDDAVSPTLAAARRTLQATGDEEIDRLGGWLLAFDYESLPSDVVPWIAAGLQVYWVVAMDRIGRDNVRALDTANVCPCCGSLPVASLRRIGGKRQGVRYLVCSLCATEWHMVRVKCSHCESTKGIGYLTLSTDPDSDAGKAAATREVVKAEVCDECSSYLKLVNLESDPSADPVADDFATLALDVLTDERGYLRVGPNLFIHPGIVAV
jgi:FdhE protein